MRRRRRSAPPPAPLEQRHGIDPVRLRLPPDPERRWATVVDHLRERYAEFAGADEFDRMVERGRFVTASGSIEARTRYEPGLYVWFHRDFAPEEAVPFPVGVVHRDERIVVADKPHFLATTPRGSHITETALARLRRELSLPELQPAHRLDRLTAGLVLFVVRPADRGAYQSLFQDRRVRKEYVAVARHDPALTFPRTVRNRIEKVPGRLAAVELPGEPNSESRIELLGHRDGLAGYRLLPTTGRTHQLRLHMSGLGLPLLHDPLFPDDHRPDAHHPAPHLADSERPDPHRPAPHRPDSATAPPGPDAVRHGVDDWDRPLQLLARALEFTDPVTGEEIRCTSRLRLSHWPLPG
ncbi:pseudouridine synthase [Streptomyces sp. XM4193]|uniref:pseudouridine synthase n=1 Tax=Streptomyces sp. XM4193 TaxID=2929782 RepID=UPI001FF7F5CA|nr:pseudouridine synthase [Streptomyces sp. XM4193]MCK1797271.1 pseudouridine synthase [Streptomyces sp. XM4193]